jgi:hypothetical protein
MDDPKTNLDHIGPNPCFDYSIGSAVVEKTQYNRQRADHTFAARAAEGGKKF